MEMELNSGRMVDVTQVSHEDICWRDIIIPLTRQCRYANHSQVNYTVAHHLMLGYQMATFLGFTRKQKQYFLIHDLHEAYVMDVPRPLKGLLEGYQEIEDRAELAVRNWIGLPEPDEGTRQLVKDLDVELLYWEGQYVMNNTGNWAEKYKRFDYDFSFMAIDFKNPSIHVKEWLAKTLEREFGGVFADLSSENYA